MAVRNGGWSGGASQMCLSVIISIATMAACIALVDARAQSRTGRYTDTLPIADTSAFILLRN